MSVMRSKAKIRSRPRHHPQPRIPQLQNSPYRHVSSAYSCAPYVKSPPVSPIAQTPPPETPPQSPPCPESHPPPSLTPRPPPASPPQTHLPPSYPLRQS